MDISVIIVGWNAKHYLELCLESMRTAPPRRSTEVIVVDNASVDGSAEMIASRFPEVKVIRNAENVGFAKGNNIAIRQCTGRYIALVNPDVQVLPGCLDALADFMDQNPTVGNVGPRVLNPDMSMQSTCRHFPTLWNNFCLAAGLATAFRNSRLFSGEHMHYFPHDETIPVDVLVGCFWMMRRETVEAIGLLDEEFWVYGEDLDWCKRCWKAGWKVMFYPGGRAIHDRGKITAGYPERFAVAQQRSVLYYWKKHHGWWGVWGIKSILFCRYFLRYAFSVVSGLIHFYKGKTKDTRKEVSIACLRALVSERVGHQS